ncbi:MAG: ribonuclease P protein component [Candidatus Eisenbacteria bacterium]|nr:ribonuclease P protein component [Candidatus Eisenbacteria bacterium]
MPWGDEPLRTKEAINRLFQEGVVYHGRHVLLMARRVPEGPRRVLFVASRRVGNAVRRNRAKRVMRAAYQNLVPGLATQESHLGWIARASSAEQSMQVIETDMRELLRRARLIASSAGAPGRSPQSQDDRT